MEGTEVMGTIDIILTIVNVVIAVFSLVCAIRSWKYYKKSKLLSSHTQLNKALVEVGKIQNKLPEALEASNRNRRKNKAFNLYGVIGDIGSEIHMSYVEMHANIPADLTEEYQKLQSDTCFDMQKYINGFISGDVIINDTLDSGDFAACQECLMKMQNYLKKKIDDMGEKLK